MKTNAFKATSIWRILAELRKGHRVKKAVGSGAVTVDDGVGSAVWETGRVGAGDEVGVWEAENVGLGSRRSAVR
jgi:hypothetical protein